MCGVQDEQGAVAKRSLSVLTELYRRKVWTDAKTVNVICSACFHPHSQILVAALKFLLGTDEAMDGAEDAADDDSDDEEAAPGPSSAWTSSRAT